MADLTNRFTWQPDPAEPTISLVLKNAQQTIVLLDQQPNTGSFVWTVPQNLPSGSYVLEIGSGLTPKYQKYANTSGPPNALTGSSTSAQFTVQACTTCSSVPSTALFTSSGATIVNSGTATAVASVTGTGSAASATGNGSQTTLATSTQAGATVSGGTSVIVKTATASGSAASSTGHATSSASAVGGNMGRWVGVFVGTGGFVVFASFF